MKRRDFFKLLGITALVSFSARTASARVCEKQNALLDRIYPKGSIYITVSDDNPEITLGGKWDRFAQGRTLIGVSTHSSDTTNIPGEAFGRLNAAKLEGGSKTHRLTERQMAKHTHIQKEHHHQMSDVGGYASGISGGPADEYNPGATIQKRKTNSIVAVNEPSGEDVAHNNLQPYITVYIWQRMS